MILALLPDWFRSPQGGGGWLRQLSDEGVPTGPQRWIGDVKPAVREIAMANQGTRWLWPSTAVCYPPLLADGLRLARCHDVTVTEALLGCSVASGPTRGLGAIDRLDDLVAAYTDQRERCATAAQPGRLRTLIAAESAAALAAVEIRPERERAAARPGLAHVVVSSDTMEPRTLATEWSLVTLARVRLALAGTEASLVSYRPGRLIVRCPEAAVSATGDLLTRAGEETRQLLCPEPAADYPFAVSVMT